MPKIFHQSHGLDVGGSANHHHAGLRADLDRLLAQGQQRRRSLRLMLGVGTLALAGCGGGESASGSGASTTTTAAADTATTTSPSITTATTNTTTSAPVTSCATIPEETAGPYPGDGSNTSGGSIANALALAGIIRSDIRSSIAGASGVAAGVPLTVKLRLINTSASCADLVNYAMYLWHCDREGRYSMYTSGVTAENYLRGVQPASADGTVSFTTVFPGCYAGRMPHIHFEVFRNTAAINAYTNRIKTSQLALPTDICQAVYAAADGYSASVRNLSQISFQTDNVFSDGVTRQLATVTGSLGEGFVASLNVGVAA